MTNLDTNRFDRALMQDQERDAHVALGSLVGDFLRSEQLPPGRHDIADVITMMQSNPEWLQRVSAILPDTCFGDNATTVADQA